MFFARWRARRANRILIDQIHGEIVAAARAPALFARWGVPDDLDGRFEMVTLHAGLVLGRLGDLGESAAQIAQDVVDSVFLGFDDALREMAISDAGVARRMKTMAGAFFGRSKVYSEAIRARDPAALAAALARNVYRKSNPADAPHAPELANYVLATSDALSREPLEVFAEGRFHFPAAWGGET